MLRDIRLGLRILLRHRSYAATAITVMVLGVGATTAVFSVLRGVLLAPLPYRDAERLVLVRADLPGITRAPALTSTEFHALRARSDLFESVAAAVPADGNLTAPDIMAPVSAAAISEEFVSTLGLAPALGRPLRRGDSGARGSINISHELWQQRFGSNPQIVGAAIEVNGNQLTVAGVLPAGFKAHLGAGVALPSQLDILYFRGTGYDDDPIRANVVIARLRAEVAIAAAQAAVDAIAKNLVLDHPDRYRTGPVNLSLASLPDEVARDAKPALMAAAAAVALVLLVACANITNLLLARTAGRTRDIAVRLAIGARRRDIVRQLAAEGLVVGAAGALGGWLLAQWGVAALLSLAPATLPRREAITIDSPIVLLAIAIAVVCALVVSLVPAWHATRPDVIGGVKENATSSARTRGALVAAQLAMSVILLVGAGLMARAFVNMRSLPLGFDPRNVASLFVSFAGEPFNRGTIDEERAARREVYERLIEQTRELTGVVQAGAGFPLPLSGIAMSQRVSLGPGSPERETDGFIALAGYLEALNVPLIDGRYFSRADNRQPAVIVDQRLAQELWPGQSPVGRRLMIVRSVSAPLWTEVVGVVAHVQSRALRASDVPQVWMTNTVRSYAQLNVVVRARDASAVVPAVTDAVRRLGSNRPVRDIRLLEELVADASADTRFALFVIGLFAVVAVVLAGVGVYGVVAYAMARRAREIAVRLALGESPRRLVARVLSDGARWTVMGLVAGLGGAALMARSLESLLFGVTPHDAVTFVGVAAALAGVALAASIIPALAAARADPMRALRSE